MRNKDSSRDIPLCESCRWSANEIGRGISGSLMAFHTCTHPKRIYIKEEKEYDSCKYYSNEV